MSARMVGQDDRRNSNLPGRKMALHCLATALLLAVTAGSVMAQTHSTPGTDQAGGVSRHLNQQAKTGFDTDASTGNNDPEGRYNWATSYQIKDRALSYRSPSDGNSAAGANLPEFLPLEGATAKPYLSLATPKFEKEIGPAGISAAKQTMAQGGSTAAPYISLATSKLEEEFVAADGNRGYGWHDLYETSALVANASSRMAGGTGPAAVSTGALAATSVEEEPVVSLPNQIDPIKAVEPADSTVFSLLNQ